MLWCAILKLTCYVTIKPGFAYVTNLFPLLILFFIPFLIWHFWPSLQLLAMPGFLPGLICATIPPYICSSFISYFFPSLSKIAYRFLSLKLPVWRSILPATLSMTAMQLSAVLDTKELSLMSWVLQSQVWKKRLSCGFPATYPWEELHLVWLLLVPSQSLTRLLQRAIGLKGESLILL